jgi:DNA-binding transcriptional LysR family regulator
MDVHLHQLRSFVAVAEELHFGRAALRLGVSQPQVSRRVRGLEDELGVELFRRAGRRTTLTDAGAAVLEHAREALVAAERLRARADVARRGGAGRVAVGFVWSTLGAYLPRLVAAAAEQHGGIDLTVRQLRFVDVVPALRRGDVDIAIVRTLPGPSEMVGLLLRREPSLLALPDGHPLAARESVAIEQLDGQPLIALRRAMAPEAHDAAWAALHARGVEPRVVQDATTPSEALALVSAGIGVFRLPAGAASPQPGVVFRELEGVFSTCELLRRPEPPAPPVATIVELARRLFSDADDASKHAPRDLEVRIVDP